MTTITDINYQINSLTAIFNDFLEYVDSVNFVDENLKAFVISDTLLKNTEKSNYTAIQTLEELKKDSLNEFEYVVVSDTTIFNLCFLLYSEITDENINKLIIANDLQAFDRLDIDPNDPIIKKGTKILYYK